MKMSPIGTFFGPHEKPYDAPRQASRDSSLCYVELEAGKNYEQALKDLEGCSHIWLIYAFHKNKGWKPKVQTPRNSERKIGLFATRSPYRPNPIGISAVRLIKVKGRKIYLENADLLNETPILDIKPYLAYADLIEDSKVDWVDNAIEYDLRYSKQADSQLKWLNNAGVKIKEFLKDQLRYSPNPSSNKRIKIVKDKPNKVLLEVSYRTWRIHVSKHKVHNELFIKSIYTAYSEIELDKSSSNYTDKYNDKDIHLEYITRFLKDESNG